MAVTISLYDSTVARLLDKSITLTTLKVMLLNNNAVFTASDTTLAGPAGASNVNEVRGNGWTQGGVTLTNVAVSTVTTNDAKLDADDVVVLASGGGIGPAYAAVVYDDTNPSDAPLIYISFGEAKSADAATDFKILWSSNGIITASYTLPL